MATQTVTKRRSIVIPVTEAGYLTHLWLEWPCRACDGTGVDCALCDYTGKVPSDAGRTILDFVADHLAREGVIREEPAPVPPPPPQPCGRCWGEGRIANSDDGEPWSVWESLMPGSDLAVKLGVVRPIPCPACNGSGEAHP